MFSEKYSRREVLKTLVWGTALSAGGSGSVAQGLWGEVGPRDEKAVMRVRLADFPVLSQPFGSVMIGTSGIKASRHKEGLFPPLVINRGESGQFHVMSAECTHEGCIVRKFNPQTQIMLCPEGAGLCGHGSRFRIDGTVLQGPAAQQLRPFLFEVRNGVLEIQIPEDMLFDITWTLAGAVPADRARLRFITFTDIQYEVWLYEKHGDTGRRARFSLTPEGAFTETVLDGLNDYATIYLEKPQERAFYQLAMRTKEIE